VYFKAGETHETGKGGHPGNDGAASAVVAPKQQRQGLGIHSSRTIVVVVVVIVVRRGADGCGRPKVPDGIPGVRRRGEPIRRPVGRRGRRHQEAVDVAPGLVRGQNEVRGVGRGRRAAVAPG